MTIETQIKKYHLFLDESGGFVEAKSRGTEAAAGVIVSSQEVGFIAPYRSDIRELARKTIKTVLIEAGCSPDKKIHGKDLSKGTLNTLVGKLLPYFKEYDWQPVRIVNEERVAYGTNREANQTNIVAELVLRLFEMKASHSTDEIDIYLKHDNIKLAEGSGGRAPYMTQKAILRPIDEYLAFVANRRGVAAKQAHWHLRVPELFGDAQTQAELQICDLFCTITKNDYEKCYPVLRSELEALFGEYDQTMKSYDLLREVDELVTKFNSYGLAIRSLAEFIYLVEGGSNSEATEKRLAHILDQLISVGKRSRDAQLVPLVSWLDQIIGTQRLAAAGYEIAIWIQDRVIAPLGQRLGASNQEDSINWFDFAISRWALTAANHQGNVSGGRQVMERMQTLQPSLAKRSEHIPLLMDGIVTQAVHQMDTFNFDNALKQLQWVADSLAHQSSALADLMPEAINTNTSPKYELRARALGTLTSALILQGFKDEDEFAYARLVSDDAIEEFVDLDDKARQYQLRSHLESNIGDFDEARNYLLRSFDPKTEFSEAPHDMLAQKFNETRQDSGFSFQFALAHWLRIGAKACLKGADEEAVSFYDSFLGSKVANTPWSRGERADYPANIILRFLAINQAFRGDSVNAMKSLNRLQDITKKQSDSLILRAIQVAAFSEVAAMLWPSDESAVLVGNQPRRHDFEPTLGVRQQLNLDQNPESSFFPFLSGRFTKWRNTIGSLNAIDVDSAKARELLLEISNSVPY